MNSFKQAATQYKITFKFVSSLSNYTKKESSYKALVDGMLCNVTTVITKSGKKEVIEETEDFGEGHKKVRVITESHRDDRTRFTITTEYSDNEPTKVTGYSEYGYMKVTEYSKLGYMKVTRETEYLNGKPTQTIEYCENAVTAKNNKKSRRSMTEVID